MLRLNRVGAFAAIAVTVFALSADADEVAAHVNGRAITAAEVDATIEARLAALQRQIYALRKSSLDNLITRAVLDDEAKKRGISVAELKSTLTHSSVSVTPEEVEESYQHNAAAYGDLSPDEARERVRLDLEAQQRMRQYREAVEKLSRGAAIEIVLEEPVAASVAAAGAPARGGANARVIITEFADFECTFCKEAQQALRELVLAYPDDVRVVYRHYPIAAHQNAVPAAQAGFCAGEQKRFWQFHDALFAAPRVTPQSIRDAAVAAGVDQDRFDACVASDASRLAVDRDVEAARLAGVTGTPALFINGRRFRHKIDLHTLQSAVARHLQPPASHGSALTVVRP
ncbi:MAG TPA: thioredoxin domain-containing protein [Thermoanaerobaculia bacterium]|jgi:protein-disulfide isomerase